MDTATQMRSKGGKARAEQLDKDALAEIGRKGGKARAASLGPKACSEAARRAVKVRWKKHRAKLAALKSRKRKAAA
jgi:hypothetical protein